MKTRVGSTVRIPLAPAKSQQRTLFGPASGDIVTQSGPRGFPAGVPAPAAHSERGGYADWNSWSPTKRVPFTTILKNLRPFSSVNSGGHAGIVQTAELIDYRLSSSALASLRSAVSKPSVNQP